MEPMPTPAPQGEPAIGTEADGDDQLPLRAAEEAPGDVGLAERASERISAWTEELRALWNRLRTE